MVDALAQLSGNLTRAVCESLAIATTAQVAGAVVEADKVAGSTQRCRSHARQFS